MSPDDVIQKYRQLAVFEDYAIASFDDEGMDGDTPVHVASFSCDPEALAVMLAAGARIDKRGGIGNSPLHYAVMSSCISCIRILVAAGASIDAENDYGDTPREIAMWRGFEVQAALGLSSE